MNHGIVVRAMDMLNIAPIVGIEPTFLAFPYHCANQQLHHMVRVILFNPLAAPPCKEVIGGEELCHLQEK